MDKNRATKDRQLKKKANVRLQAVFLLSIPLVVGLLYGNALRAPFVFDDSIHILRNPTVTSFESMFDFQSLYRFVSTPSGLSGRPLLMLTYALNYAASGADPAAFRRVNLLVHAANSILVFLIVFEVGRFAGFNGSRRFWSGLLAAAIFATHPLATESVTYIAGRSASLCATFYLAGVYAVVRAGHERSWRRWVLVLLAVACTVIGWFVKQDAITLPLAGIALIGLIWPAETSSRNRWMAAAVLGLALTLVLLAQSKPLQRVSAVTQGNTELMAAGYESTLPFTTYLLTSIKAYSFYYLWRLWIPLSLSVDPDISPSVAIFSPGFVISLLILLGLVFAVVWLRKRRPLLAVGLALILTSPLSAYCLFPLADVVGEHRAYIAILGAALVVVDVIVRSPQALRISLPLLVAYGCLTVSRNSVWADEARLWEDASRKAPDKMRPHLNLGAAYQLRGDSDRAIQQYELVLRDHPEQDTAVANLGALYTDRNNLQRAESLFNQAILRNSRFAPVYIGLAVVRIRQGRPDEARTLLERAQLLDPSQALMHHNLGDIFLGAGQASLAVEEYLKELKINPSSIITHLHLANAYEIQGLRREAVEHYSIVGRMDPNSPMAAAGLQRLK